MAGRGSSRRTGLVWPGGGGAGVTRLELFLDLIFVWAFINVAGLTAAELGGIGLLRGLLLLALLWWCWVSYAWLGNNVRMDRGITPVAMIGLIAVLFVVSVSIEEAFVDQPGGLPGPMVFVIGYLIARSGASLITNVGWPERAQRRKFLLAWPPLIVSGLLLVSAATLPGRLLTPPAADWLQLLLMLLAILTEYLGVLLIGVAEWRINSVSYWAERHDLIILIALGETIISVGAAGGILTWPMIAGILLSIVVVGVLWWTYFDLASGLGERALDRASDGPQVRLARDAYTFCHVAMIGGLILLALGIRHALTQLRTEGVEPITGLGLLVLYGGVVLYLLGLVIFEARAARMLGRSPVVGMALALVCLPLASQVPVLGALGLLAVAMAGMVLVDRTVFRARHQKLHAEIPSPALPMTEVTPKELFFDLVFVYAFLQVTGLMKADPTWSGLLRAAAVLTLLWWAWSGYAWLTSAVRSEAAVVRVVMLTVVAGVLLITVALPEAFHDAPGGLPGPMVFAVCYGLVRVLQIASYWAAAAGDRDRRRQVTRAFVPIMVALALLLIAAPVAPGADVAAIHPTQALLWLAALIVDFIGGARVGLRYWRFSTAEHWADRHGLIVIIAFGEAVISMGLVLAGKPLSAQAVAAGVLGTVLLGALWWIYFGVDSAVGRQAVARAAAGHRLRLARDAYTYLHLPMIAGIVLLAFGLRGALAVLDTHSVVGDLAAPSAPAHYALFGGVILFLLANQGFWWRIGRPVRPLRIVMTLTLTVVAPLTYGLSSPAVLAVLAGVCVLFASTDAYQIRGLRSIRPQHRPRNPGRLPTDTETKP